MGGECGTTHVEAAPAVPVKRIAAGLQSKPGAYPWSASIRLQGTQKSFHWCGAVILSEYYILTVAHCMEDYPKDVYRVRVGDWDMQVIWRLNFPAALTSTRKIVRFRTWRSRSSGCRPCTTTRSTTSAST